MSGKMVVLTPEDTIQLADYEDYKSIQNAVHGSIEHCFSFELPVDPVLCGGRKTIPCDLYCNDEFLISNNKEFDKINAVASLIMSGGNNIAEIRGNVVLVPYAGEGRNRGFDYKEVKIDDEVEEDLCECWAVEDVLMRYIGRNTEALKQFHAEFDNKKSIPKWEIGKL